MPRQLFAYHYDLKHAMWTREYMDLMADRLAAWGFNSIVFEVEDKFRFANHPAIVHPDAWTREQAGDFAGACRAKGIEVIPLMQSLGHVEFILRRPEYARLREAPEIEDQFDPTSAEARALVIELFDELIDAMKPREFFHMGGDETWRLGTSAKCRPLAEQLGVGGLYLEFMLPLMEHVHRRGLRPMIWADICLSHPEIIRRVPDYVVMVDWDYSITAARMKTIRLWGAGDRRKGEPANPSATWATYPSLARASFREHLAKYAVDERTPSDGAFPGFYCADALLGFGFDVITASASRCAGDMAGTPAAERHWPNCFHSARKGVDAGRGNLVTSWAVRHNHPDLGLAGAYAAVHALYNDGEYDAEAVARAFTVDTYGVELPAFARAAHQAGRSFMLGQAGHIRRARARLANGEEPLPAWVAEVKQSAGGVAATTQHLREVAAGYDEARAAFAAMREQAVKNQRHFDLWFEGLDLNRFYADVLLAALAGALAAQAPALLARLAALRATTRALFAESYPARSVEEECDLRYGLYEEVLRRA